MRIAYISYEYPPDSCNGGIATYVYQAARMMVRRGHEVEVFASSPHRSGRFMVDGILEHWIKETDRRDFGIVAGHVFALRYAERPFDVVEGPEFNADARKAVQLVPQVPLVVKMHTPTQIIDKLNSESGLVPQFKKVGRLIKHLAACAVKLRLPNPSAFNNLYSSALLECDSVESAHARMASIVAPPCEDLCNFARKEWGISADCIRLTPHPYTPSAQYLQIPIDGEGQVVGYVGRLERRKGIETLAGAIPQILRACPQAKIRLIGAASVHNSGEPYDEWLKQGLPEFAHRLEFYGKQPLDKMPGAYAELDVAVFPSIWENFPNVCLEAMAAGRAVVASSAGGMREMLDHGACGRLAEPKNPEVFARAVIGLLENPAERSRLGHLARQRVLAAYNEQVIGKKMEETYQEAINKRLF